MPNVPCRGCGNSVESETDNVKALCPDCVRKLGVQHPQTNTSRPPSPCARCGSGILVRCAIRERGGEYEHPRPLSATFGVAESQAWFSDKTSRTASTHQPIGLFEAFICRACGFTEWYCHEPDKIPIGLEYGTALVDVSKPPYR